MDKLAQKRVKQKGFTLIELMVAVSIFTVVAFIATASVIMVINAAKRANQIRLLIDNVDFAMDSMVNKIKFGSNWQISDDQISFCDRDQQYTSYIWDTVHQCIGYCQNPTSGCSVGTCADTKAYSCLTASPDVRITDLSFADISDVPPSGSSAQLFKKLKIEMSGQATVRNSHVNFRLRTSVSKQTAN